MSSETSEAAGGFADRTSSARRAVDWIIVVLLVLLGLAVSGIGGLLIGLADREWIADLVAEENVDPGPLSEAELIDLLTAGGFWGGLGVVAVGIGMIVVGVLFGIGRRRVDRLDPGEPAPTFLANALLGAFITGLTSFIPLSGLLGGGVAGYLESDDSWSGAIVGVAVGALTAAPIAAVTLAIAMGFVAEGMAVWGLGLAVAILFAVAFAIGLAAIGGAIGSYLRTRA